MNPYALVVDGTFIEIRQFDVKPSDIPHKGVKWLPFETQDIVTNQSLFTQTSSEFVVSADKVTQVNTVTDLPIEEIRPNLRCTPFQARVALKAAGLLPTVLALMASLDETDDARLAWDWAVEFQRTSPFIAALAGGLGLTEEQIDGLFFAAMQV